MNSLVTFIVTTVIFYISEIITIRLYYYIANRSTKEQKISPGFGGNLQKLNGRDITVKKSAKRLTIEDELLSDMDVIEMENNEEKMVQSQVNIVSANVLPSEGNYFLKKKK